MTRIISILATVLVAGAAVAGGHITYEDLDGDGMYSFDEVTQAGSGIDEATFQTLDADGDGLLSQEELELAIEQGDLPV